MNQKQVETKGPLDGIKIVEYGVFHAGPGGTAILGDLGADIIKIEAPSGDPVRYWTDLGAIDMATPNGESLVYEIANRNKKGLCLDIKKEEGRAVFESLVKESDVFMCNLRKSTKARMSIDYDSIRQLNEQIIYAGVSGYGPDGPMEDIGAFDPLGQACSGMMFVTGSETPKAFQVGMLDQATAIAISHAIITALFTKERQGIGQEVHASLYGSSLWLQHVNLMLANALSINPCFSSEANTPSPLRDAFCCKDGKWIMGTHHPEEKYWFAFCHATGRSDLLDNPEYTDTARRPVNYQELRKIFGQVFAEKPLSEWVEILQSHSLMFVPVQRIGDVKNDPQAQINEYVKSFDYKGIGNIDIPGYPIHFSASQAGFKTPAPEMGEHTDQIMTEMGYSKDYISRLREQDIIR